MSSGTYFHQVLQDNFLGPLGILHGNWKLGDEKRTACTHPDPLGYFRTLESNLRYAKNWEFVEQRAKDKDWKISGRIDGLLVKSRLQALMANGWPRKASYKDIYALINKIDKIKYDPEDPNEFVLFEIKTAGDYKFKSIKGAEDLPDSNRLQAAVYQAATGIPGTVFLFMHRESFKIKTLYYPYTPSDLQLAQQIMKEIHVAIYNKTLPVNFMACNNSGSSAAKKCPFASECWDKELRFDQFIENQPKQKNYWYSEPLEKENADDKTK